MRSGRSPAKNPAAVRVGTWNLRWFPDGVPFYRTDPRLALDVPWVACVLAYLKVDLVALQEIKTHKKARSATRLLLRRLDELTGGRWRIRLDGCKGPVRKHTGILWNSASVGLLHLRDEGIINPNGRACGGYHPPGVAAYVRSRIHPGIDFHFLSLHLEPGTDKRSFQRRKKSISRLEEVFQRARRLVPDGMIVGGDWNVEGCRSCSPPETAETERSMMVQRIHSTGGAKKKFRMIEARLPCSWYSEEDKGRTRALLDLFLARGPVPELDAAQARISGYCEAAGCRHVDPLPKAFFHLSDHCPVYVDLEARASAPR